MKFSGKEDIEERAEKVFERLTDYETHERAALRRGVKIQRVRDPGTPEPGMAWDIRLKFRGKQRKIDAQIEEFTPCERVVYDLQGSGLGGTLEIDLVPLSRGRTRLAVGLEFRPKNLTGRLLMQSLRILKPNLNKRFQKRLVQYSNILAGLPPEGTG